MYFLNINQKAFVDHFPTCDFNDAALISFVRYWKEKDISEKLFYTEKTFVWFSAKFISEQLPMLHIKTYRGIKKRLDKLTDLGLLEAHPDNQKMNKSFYALGSKFDLIITAQRMNQSSEGMNGSSEGYEPAFRRRMNGSSDNNIKEDNIKEDNIKGNARAFQKPTIRELDQFFVSIGLSNSAAQDQAEIFINHYQSNGWKVGGKSPMKDWKAAARNWKRRIKNYKNQKNEHTTRVEPKKGRAFGTV